MYLVYKLLYTRQIMWKGLSDSITYWNKLVVHILVFPFCVLLFSFHPWKLQNDIHSGKTPSSHWKQSKLSLGSRRTFVFWLFPSPLKDGCRWYFTTRLYLLSSQARPGNVKLGMHSVFESLHLGMEALSIRGLQYWIGLRNPEQATL